MGAEGRGDFKRALQLLDEAAEIMQPPADKVWRAKLLLSLERVDDAYHAFDLLRQEFKGSDDPNLRYLRHYCTAMLSLMQPGSGQWSYEARQANAIKCTARIKLMLPMVTVDEIHDRIKPRR